MSLGPIPYKPMPRATLEALIAEAQAGNDDARNRVVTQVLRLVVLEAHRYARRLGRIADADELVQVGVIGSKGRGGVIRAIATFDAARGKAFGTHAMHAAKGAMREWLATTPTSGRRGAVLGARVRRVCNELQQQLGRLPDDAEIRGAFIAAGSPAPSRARIATGLRGAPVLLSRDELLDDVRGVDAHAADSDGMSEGALADGVDALRDRRRLPGALARLTPHERAGIEWLYGLSLAWPVGAQLSGSSLAGAHRKLCAALRPSYGPLPTPARIRAAVTALPEARAVALTGCQPGVIRKMRTGKPVKLAAFVKAGRALGLRP